MISKHIAIDFQRCSSTTSTLVFSTSEISTTSSFKNMYESRSFRTKLRKEHFMNVAIIKDSSKNFLNSELQLSKIINIRQIIRFACNVYAK